MRKVELLPTRVCEASYGPVQNPQNVNSCFDSPHPEGQDEEENM